MSRRAPKRPTVALIEEATRYLRAGVPVETTAKLLLGTRWDEFFAWVAAGHGQHPTLLRRKPYTTLADAVERALAECEARHAAIVQKEGSPRWSAWWLQRRHPERWGSVETLKHAVDESATEFLKQIRALKAEPYTDPRMLPEGDPESTKEPAVVVEDIIEVRPGCDRPHKDEPETVEGRPSAAIPEVIKRPVIE